MLHIRSATGGMPHNSLPSEAPPPRARRCDACWQNIHHKHDERGITLQTLIVTAVLVLVAAAASVIIVAITNSSSDDLEGQQSDVETRCEPWEIFDPAMAARGIGAGNGGVRSSSIGCVRACYIEFARDKRQNHWSDLEAVLKGPGGEDRGGGVGARILDNWGFWGGVGNTRLLIDLNGQDIPSPLTNSGNAKLLFSHTGIYDAGPNYRAVSTVADARQRYPVIGNRIVGLISDQYNEIDLHIGQIMGKPNSWATARADMQSDRTNPEIANLEIRVSPNQKYCSVWDTVTGKEISALRSQN